VGFSSTNDVNRINEASILAVRSARVRGSDPQWSGLPGKSKPASVRDIFDRKIKDIQIEGCIDLAFEMIQGSKSISSVVPTSGHFVCGDSTKFILNSNGVEIQEEDTVVQASMDVITNDAPISTASEFDMSRKLDVDFYKIGAEASSLAKRSQNGISTQTRDCHVLLEPMAIADILENTLITSVDADNIQKGRSSLIGKIGTSLAAEELSIIDDGTFAGGLGTSSCDEEGTPSKITPIIKNGILSSYIYDCYTAGKEKRESTGNAVRGSYTSTPSIGIRNLIIEHPSFDVIEQTNDGVIVNSVIGAHTANPISGDFSVEARNSFEIKDGQITSPIKSMMISGNIFELLKNIDGMGKDVRKVGPVITPTVRVAKMRVIGT
jgi:PmbA protein